MAKSGSYRIAYTYARYNDEDVMVYETGRSPIFGPQTINGVGSIGGSYTTDPQINKIRIYSTLNGGSVYYLEKVINNDTTGGTWWTSLSMSDSELDDQATAYWTNKGYEVKRLNTSGVLHPMRHVVEASGRLWGLGRMHRTGTDEDSTLYWSELAPNFRDWPVANANTKFAVTLTGLYEYQELVYVFTRESRWKVTPATYNAGMRFEKLEGQVGCIAGHSIVKVGSAVLWLAQDGFYATVGDQHPQLISGAIKDTIKDIHTPCNSLHNVIRRSHSHQVSRFIFRQKWINHFKHS